MSRKRKIDKVTTDRLDMVLRMCGINLPLDLVDNIIDVVELIEDNGGNTSLKDVTNLQKSWNLSGHNFIK